MTTQQLRPPTLGELRDFAQVLQGWRDLTNELRRQSPELQRFSGFTLASLTQEREETQQAVDRLRTQLDAAERRLNFLAAAVRQCEAANDLLKLAAELATPGEDVGG